MMYFFLVEKNTPTKILSNLGTQITLFPWLNFKFCHKSSFRLPHDNPSEFSIVKYLFL